MNIIDFHTHVFPDHLAERTIPALEEKGNVKAVLDGKLQSLRASMRNAGISLSVVCSIATKPSQFASILAWSEKIRSDDIEPFPSFHPEDADAPDRIRLIKERGFRGIKLHPYYQDFAIDEERLFPAYEEVCRQDLIIVFHAGFDIGYPRVDIASPRRIMSIAERFPDMKIVATHVGGWNQWDETEAFLLGRPVYLDLSYSLQFLSRDDAARLLSNHLPEYLLFGSDSPWADQSHTIRLLEELQLGEELRRKILCRNARQLLGDSLGGI